VRKANWRTLILFVLSLVVIALDQWTKTWVRANLAEGASWNPITWLSPFVTLTHIHNTGVAFGMFPNRGNLFVFVTVIVVTAIVFYYRRLATSSWALCLALGLQLGGAIGNLIDRVARGYVTDFVNVRVFAVFNVADSALVVGAILLGVFALFMDNEKPVAAPSVEPAPPAPDGPSPESH
jgi:signal peptidase II